MHKNGMHEICGDLFFLLEFVMLMVRWLGHVANMGGMWNACNILVGRPEGKRLLRRPWHRWEDNIRMNLRELGWKDVDWMYPTQDRDQWWALVNMVMNIWVPEMAGNFLTSRVIIGSSRMTLLHGVGPSVSHYVMAWIMLLFHCWNYITFLWYCMWILTLLTYIIMSQFRHWPDWCSWDGCKIWWNWRYSKAVQIYTW